MSRFNFRSGRALPVSFVAVLSLSAVATMAAHAQSTTGSFVGTVKDPTGSVIVNAKVTLSNVKTGRALVDTTNKAGQYELLNVEPGSYTIDIEAPGFTRLTFTDLTLLSRETRRADGILTVGAADTSVTVQAAAAVINTDTPNIAQTREGIELTTLPIAISSIQGGSTSPYSTLQTQAGVTQDSQGNLNVAGSTQAMLNVTVDGISTINANSAAVAQEMFPSFNAIEEIRVSQNANAAEFGGTTDITTVSKGGNNNAHGQAFDNYQSKGFNSNSPFTPTTKANLVLNDFGGFYGGPVRIPWLYNGKDKTFYFLSYEGLRRPNQSTAVLSVPTLAERNGDFSAFTKQLYHSDGITPWSGNQIPLSQWSSTSKYLMNTFYPLPNTGSVGQLANNYTTNINTPITSDQGDARFDHNFTSRQTAYVRYSYKQRSVQSALNSGLGTISTPEKDTSLTGAYNYIITPYLLNEFRSGLSKYISASSFNSNSSIVTNAGIQGIPNLLPTSVAAEPGLTITGLTTITGSSSIRSSNT
ncbi:MAG TPA: carboxypeptidase-like regulatory domain-containing protein, partial [Terriglobus sp.]